MAFHPFDGGEEIWHGSDPATHNASLSEGKALAVVVWDFRETPHRRRDNTDFPRQMRKSEARLHLACPPSPGATARRTGAMLVVRATPQILPLVRHGGGHGWKPGWKPGRTPLPPLRGGRSHHSDPWREGCRSAVKGSYFDFEDAMRSWSSATSFSASATCSAVIFVRSTLSVGCPFVWELAPLSKATLSQAKATT